MEYRSQLGPGTLSMVQALTVPSTFAEVLAEMPRSQPRGVDRSRWRSVKQAGRPGPLDDDHLGVMEDPPCSASGRRQHAA
jgi:hypothetical protein